MPNRPLPHTPPAWVVAVALALAAAVSLGLARFSYALLLPPMRADLGWSYLTAGAMNTVNAAGYLMGALAVPAWMRRFGPRRVLLAGGMAAALLLMGHGMTHSNAWLYGLRLGTGLASAAMFVAGGLMAAQLAGSTAQAQQSGLILGLYYGGTGLGIVASTALVPPLSSMNTAHAWQWAWVALGFCAALATLFTAWATRQQGNAPSPATPPGRWHWPHFAYGLAAYFCFGLGYIGYMTFIITLLREQQLGSTTITAFYALLGGAVVASSWLWASLLQRHRGGESMRLLNALLAAATILPVWSQHPLAVFSSGLLFGGVFLSVVASTTALVRHNLPAAAWSSGISAFTIVFAAGQIIGPLLAGGVADGSGGLRTGLALSAAVLALGALLAWGQKPVDSSR